MEVNFLFAGTYLWTYFKDAFILKTHGHMNTMKTLANINYLLIKLLKNTDEQIFRVLCFPHMSSKVLQIKTLYKIFFKNQVKITSGIWLRIRKWIFLSYKTHFYDRKKEKTSIYRVSLMWYYVTTLRILLSYSSFTTALWDTYGYLQSYRR